MTLRDFATMTLWAAALAGLMATFGLSALAQTTTPAPQAPAAIAPAQATTATPPAAPVTAAPIEPMVPPIQRVMPPAPKLDPRLSGKPAPPAKTKAAAKSLNSKTRVPARSGTAATVIAPAAKAPNAAPAPTATKAPPAAKALPVPKNAKAPAGAGKTTAAPAPAQPKAQ